jgi:hypothetical protein
MSRDWQMDMERAENFADYQQWIDDPEPIEVILRYWLLETKGICEVSQQKQREILSLRIRLAAEKEHATNLIADLLFSYINKDAECPHDFEVKALEDAISYIQEHGQSKYSLELFENHLKQMRGVTGNE